MAQLWQHACRIFEQNRLVMHNPFGRLTTRLLCSLLAGGNRYFVRQTFFARFEPARSYAKGGIPVYALQLVW